VSITSLRTKELTGKVFIASSICSNLILASRPYISSFIVFLPIFSRRTIKSLFMAY